MYQYKAICAFHDSEIVETCKTHIVPEVDPISKRWCRWSRHTRRVVAASWSSTCTKTMVEVVSVFGIDKKRTTPASANNTHDSSLLIITRCVSPKFRDSSLPRQPCSLVISNIPPDSHPIAMQGLTFSSHHLSLV